MKVLFKIIKQITCMLSMSSELSQNIVDNFTFLISFSCNLDHGFIQNISLALQPAQWWMRRPAWVLVPISVSEPVRAQMQKITNEWNGEPEVVELPADDAGKCGTDLITWWLYSACLNPDDCFYLWQSPTIEPGRGLSLIPAVHRSRCSGLSYIAP